MSKLKTNGFNFVDLEKDNSDLDFNLGAGRDMEKELKIKGKKKKKINFDNILPLPKNNENMGLDDFGNKKAFEGLF